MRWADFIARTAVRRVVWILVGLVAYGLLSLFAPVRAQTSCISSNALTAACTTIEEADQAIQAVAQRYINSRPAGQTWVSCGYRHERSAVPGRGTFHITVMDANAGLPCSWPNNRHYSRTYTSACPVGAPWDDAQRRCFDPGECDDRNNEPGFKDVGEVVRAFKQRCISGCMFRAVPGEPNICTGVLGAADYRCTGRYEWGGACATPPPANPNDPPETPDDHRDPPPESCMAAPGGQSFCIRDDGQHCYSVTRTGGKFCYAPGETGEKGSGDSLQTRGPGTQPLPPKNPTSPTGDTIQPDGSPPVTTTTTRTDRNGNTTTIVTTTRNHRTEQGTDAKPGEKDQAVGEAKKGGGSKGDDDEDQKGSADGGQDCESKPIVKGDAILGMIADQAWYTRCAVEAGNAAKVTGDVADCKSPFSVEGENANAVQLRAMRKQICGEEEAREAEQTALEGVKDGEEAELQGLMQMLDEAEERGIWGEGPPGGGEGNGINPNWLSFGGGACPQLSFEIRGVGTWTAPPAFCNAIAALAALFQLAAALWALRIISE